MRAGRRPAGGGAGAFGGRVGERDGGEQGPGVGVAGVGEDAGGGAGLDGAAEVHDGDPVGEVAHHRQVVRDEQVGEAEFGLQPLEQVEHPGLDGDVEGGDGFVQHQQVGADGEGAGDGDPLALAAGELVRVAVGVRGVEADLAQQFGDAPAGLRGGGALGEQRFGEHVADRHPGVEGGGRVLEDDLDPGAQSPDRGPVEGGGVPAEEFDPAALRGGQPEDLVQGGGLAGAGLADQAERLAPPDVEVDAVDGMHLAGPAAQQAAAVAGEAAGETVDGEDGLAFGARAGDGGGGRQLRDGVHLGGGGPGGGEVVGADAGGEVGRRGFAGAGERRLRGAAALLDQRAAVGERAAGAGEFTGGGRGAGDRDEWSAAAVEPGDGADQAERVGVPGGGVQLVDGSGLDDPPGVHDGDPVGAARDHPEVVADQDQGGAALPLGDAQHVEDLGLDGDVEGGGGFVGEQHVGVVGHRHGDHGALAHAAGELVREGVQGAGRVGDADQVEQVGGALAGGGPAEVLVDADGFGDLVADPVDRGEGGQRVLEDHGDPAAADLGELPGGQADQFAAVQPDRAAGAGGGGQQAEHSERGDGLAGAGLADQAERLAPVQVEVDAADRRVAVEVDGEVADSEQRRGRRSGRWRGGLRRGRRRRGRRWRGGRGGHGVLRREGVVVGRRRRGRRAGRRRPAAAVGSRASRRPSPTRLTASTNSTSSPAAK